MILKLNAMYSYVYGKETHLSSTIFSQTLFTTLVTTEVHSMAFLNWSQDYGQEHFKYTFFTKPFPSLSQIISCYLVETLVFLFHEKFAP